MTAPPKTMIAGNTVNGPTVGAGYARSLLEFAISKGASGPALLAAAGIAPDALDDADDRLPFSAYMALMRAAKAACNDPALALHFGAELALSDISIVGLIGEASATMGDALAQINRYGRLVVEVDGIGEGPRFDLRPGPGGLWLADLRANPNDFPELTESTFARTITGPRKFGITQVAQAVHVTHPRPPYWQEYERIFGAPVTFDADWNAYRIDPGLASFPLARQPRYVFGVLSEHAEALLASLENSKTLRGRIESLLMPGLHTGEGNVDSIASKLAMSRQTLYRKLKAEGATFEEVLEGLRHKMALHYLQGKKVSVNETAYLVGFSDPAAFSRAFKRWTGKSPKEMRGVSDIASQREN
jgi:AraC-like DNA-binding protein